MGKQWQTLFLGAPKSLQMVTAAMKLKDTYSNLDSILKSRDITLPAKVRLVKAMVSPVVLYGCESWTIKKPEHQRIDAFELCCWRRLLRVPWTARRSNHSWWWSWNSQYFGHLMWRTDSFEKTLNLGKSEGRTKRGWQRMRLWHHWLDGHEFEQPPGVGDRQGSLVCCSPWGHKEWDWVTELNWRSIFIILYSSDLLIFITV